MSMKTYTNHKHLFRSYLISFLVFMGISVLLWGVKHRSLSATLLSPIYPIVSLFESDAVTQSTKIPTAVVICSTILLIWAFAHFKRNLPLFIASHIALSFYWFWCFVLMGQGA